MNYKKAWEMLMVTGNKETLKQMQDIEETLNKTKKPEKIEIKLYEYATISGLKEKLAEYDKEQLKQIIKENYYSWSEFSKYSREEIIERFARRVDNFKHRGDCFRGCSSQQE